MLKFDGIPWHFFHSSIFHCRYLERQESRNFESVPRKWHGNEAKIVVLILETKIGMRQFVCGNSHTYRWFEIGECFCISTLASFLHWLWNYLLVLLNSLVFSFLSIFSTFLSYCFHTYPVGTDLAAANFHIGTRFLNLDSFRKIIWLQVGLSLKPIFCLWRTTPARLPAGNLLHLVRASISSILICHHFLTKKILPQLCHNLLIW